MEDSKLPENNPDLLDLFVKAHQGMDNIMSELMPLVQAIHTDYVQQLAALTGVEESEVITRVHLLKKKFKAEFEALNKEKK